MVQKSTQYLNQLPCDSGHEAAAQVILFGVPRKIGRRTRHDPP